MAGALAGPQMSGSAARDADAGDDGGDAGRRAGAAAPPRVAKDEGLMARLSRRGAIAALAGAALLGGAAALGTSFSHSREASRRRLAGRSATVRTRYGQLEYASAGAGPPLLMIHGTGGGFDQGLGFAGKMLGRGYRVIAPSRFGYLRSDFPEDPSSERQADAFVDLLDRLGIERLPVAGGSAGALSAAQFALRHPDRCSALILLVPAANVRGSDPVEMGSLTRFLVERVLASDLLFWAALNTIPDRLIATLLATDPALVAAASPEERARAYRILEEIMPVSDRARGIVNDARLAGNPARMDFSRIQVPTLVISVEDDRFGTAATARDIAAAVPHARLVIYPSGGHIWIGHDEAIAAEMNGFLGALERAS
jgi:2-hydroxy-6-oxonona-2,4-dienedioate hydrolase